MCVSIAVIKNIQLIKFKKLLMKIEVPTFSELFLLRRAASPFNEAPMVLVLLMPLPETRPLLPF